MRDLLWLLLLLLLLWLLFLMLQPPLHINLHTQLLLQRQQLSNTASHNSHNERVCCDNLLQLHNFALQKLPSRFQQLLPHSNRLLRFEPALPRKRYRCGLYRAHTACPHLHQRNLRFQLRLDAASFSPLPPVVPDCQPVPMGVQARLQHIPQPRPCVRSSVLLLRRCSSAGRAQTTRTHPDDRRRNILACAVCFWGRVRRCRSPRHYDRRGAHLHASAICYRG